MNIENFAEWYRRQGHHVIHTASSYWFDAAPRVYQAFPFDWLINPSTSELRGMLLKYGIVSVRYSTPLEASTGKISYHITLTNPYNLDALRSQARNAVRRGFSNCHVERIPFERLAEEGWNLQRDTLDRQGRSDSMTEGDWRRICLSAVGLEGFEAWAALVDGELAASLITARIGNIWFVPYSLSHRKFLHLYVNNALFYSFSSNILAREGIKRIFFNVQSLDAPKSVDEFKIRMGFNVKAIRQTVIFNPIIEPLINNSTYRLVNSLLKHYPEKSVLAKVEGMLRFYLDGKLSIEQQEWPDCLSQYKSEVIPQNVLKTGALVNNFINLPSPTGENDGKS